MNKEDLQLDALFKRAVDVRSGSSREIYTDWIDFINKEGELKARACKRAKLYDPTLSKEARTVPKYWIGVYWEDTGDEGEIQYFDTQEETEAWILARVILG